MISIFVVGTLSLPQWDDVVYERLSFDEISSRWGQRKIGWFSLHKNAKEAFEIVNEATYENVFKLKKCF